ncbi:uncharacterized protein LOC126823988 [Patella vulgata]|uniref:uncharacterized protein LOC126823988 n=1 Tax=Patella vulgata TaxID=6465 RepID=UPI002180613B|nr:uncharacterized protein LOC126823988 [Patella vulgata]
MDALQELSEDFLTCSICLNMYTDPKQLSCLHSFCRDCLSDHIKACDKGGVVAFPCPMCRKNISPPSHEFSDPADDFPDNFYIASLVSSVARKGGGGYPECSVKESRDDDSCQNHPSVTADEYCMSQKITVCSVCRPSHSSCEEDHVSLQAAKTKVASLIIVLTAKTDTTHSVSKGLQDKLEAKPLNLRHRKDELQMEISEHFSAIRNKFVKHLIDREKDVTTKLQNMVKEEEKKTEEATEECKNITQSCEKKLEQLEKLSVKGTFMSLEYLNTLEILLEKLNEDAVKIESKTDVNNIKYVPDLEIDDILKNVKIGDVVDGSDHALEKTEKSPKLPVSTVTASSAIPSAPLLEQSYESLNAAAAYRPSWPQTTLSQQPLTYQYREPRSYAYAPQAPQAYVSPPPPSPYYTVPAQYGNQSFNRYQPRTNVAQGPQRPAQTRPFKRYVNPSQNPDRFFLDRARDRQEMDELKRTATLSCRLPNDSRACKIVGLTAIKEDTFVVVDRFNQNIKLVRLNGQGMKYIQFGSNMEPWDATRVLSFEREEVAVTCPGARTIIVVSVVSSSKNKRLHLDLKLGSEISTTVGYSSLGCINDKTLVCGVCNPYGPPEIHVISMNGRILRVHKSVVTYPRSIDTSPGKIIAVSDWTVKEVVLMTDEGEVVSRYRGQGKWDLKEPMGLTYYKDDCFIVVDRKTGFIHRITEDGVQERVGRTIDNAHMVTCVFTSSTFSQDGLAVVVASDNGCIAVYEGC